MTLRSTLSQFKTTTWRDEAHQSGSRFIAEETAVAFVYHGATEAVMMATPLDLEDFAVGFSLTEGIVGKAADIEALEIVGSDLGVELRMALVEKDRDNAVSRRRQRAGPAGCGLCGIESLSQAMRALPTVSTTFPIHREAIAAGMRRLSDKQSLNHKTRSVHAAGFYRPRDNSIIVREDVGRHNAVDKVAGALARSNAETDGLLLLTSRVSVELVQKAAMMGISALAAISAPTALALRVAEAAGICVIGIVRDDGMECFTFPDRLRP